MRVFIFGGTTEGRRLSFQLADMGLDVTVSVATEYGREEMGDRRGVTVLTGRLDADAMAAILSGFDACVDATHPYAREARANIKSACQQTGIEYRRLSRKTGNNTAGIVINSADEIREYLCGRQGNIMLAVGAKELAVYAPLGGGRLYPRVLPCHESISACEAAGILHRNIIAMQGPFSVDLNVALIRHYNIKYLVTKDGGQAGGFAEKAEAARLGGAELIVLSPPEDEGQDYDEILRHFRRLCMEDVERG